MLHNCLQYSYVDMHVIAQLMSAQEEKAEEYLPALPFHSSSRQAEKYYYISTKWLRKNAFKSHKAEVWKLSCNPEGCCKNPRDVQL